MHTYIHCSPVYNSKDLEPTQMPINDRLDKENVVHIHHGILRSHKKRWARVLCRDLDESGNHHSQQPDTRTESQTLYVLNIGGCWTRRTHGLRERNITHWGLSGGNRGGTVGGGELGRESMGKNAPEIGDGEEGSTSPYHVCTYATILHVPHLYPKT